MVHSLVLKFWSLTYEITLMWMYFRGPCNTELIFMLWSNLRITQFVQSEIGDMPGLWRLSVSFESDMRMWILLKGLHSSEHWQQYRAWKWTLSICSRSSWTAKYFVIQWRFQCIYLLTRLECNHLMHVLHVRTSSTNDLCSCSASLACFYLL